MSVIFPTTINPYYYNNVAIQQTSSPSNLFYLWSPLVIAGVVFAIIIAILTIACITCCLCNLCAYGSCCPGDGASCCCCWANPCLCSCPAPPTCYCCQCQPPPERTIPARRLSCGSVRSVRSMGSIRFNRPRRPMVTFNNDSYVSRGKRMCTRRGGGDDIVIINRGHHQQQRGGVISCYTMDQPAAPVEQPSYNFERMLPSMMPIRNMVQPQPATVRRMTCSDQTPGIQLVQESPTEYCLTNVDGGGGGGGMSMPSARRLDDDDDFHIEIVSTGGGGGCGGGGGGCIPCSSQNGAMMSNSFYPNLPTYNQY